MKTNKQNKVVRNIWGMVMLFLAALVVPTPTANRWLTKMGESTNNLLSYGLTKLIDYKVSQSLYMYKLAS